ncbi:hypothetical protein GCM10027568_11100 [Humibacter soli]
MIPDGKAGLDASRSERGYGGPVVDPTFTALLKAIDAGHVPSDWQVSGPRYVERDPYVGHNGLTLDGKQIRMPQSMGHVRLNLMPEVAAAVLRYIGEIAEPAPSRSGKSCTYRLRKQLRKKNARTVEAATSGPGNDPNETSK